MPTLLGLLDLPIPGSVEGSSLARCALGREGEEPEAAFLQGMGHTYLWEDGDEWRALRDKQYTYARLIGGEERLFDHRADPYQMCDLTAEPAYADTLAKYRAMLDRRMAELRDTMMPCTWYDGRWVIDRKIVRSATRSIG
jgi:arylsulfatase A-like enzyme